MAGLDLYYNRKKNEITLCSYLKDERFGFGVFSGAHVTMPLDSFIANAKEIILTDLDAYTTRKSVGSNVGAILKPFQKFTYIGVSLKDSGEIVFARMIKDRSSGGFVGDLDNPAIIDRNAPDEDYVKSMRHVLDLD